MSRIKDQRKNIKKIAKRIAAYEKIMQDFPNNRGSYTKPGNPGK